MHVALLGRQMLRQPFDQPVHLGDLLGFGELVLLRPARDLARDIIAGLAEILKAELFVIELVQPRERLVHRVIDFACVACGV